MCAALYASVEEGKRAEKMDLHFDVHLGSNHVAHQRYAPKTTAHAPHDPIARSTKHGHAHDADGAAPCRVQHRQQGFCGSKERVEDRVHGVTMVQGSQFPGVSPSRCHDPMDTRMSRSVGKPTAAVMRRTCRFFPSVSVNSIHESGTVSLVRMGGVRGGQVGSMSLALQGFVTKDFPFARNSMGASNRAKCSSVASPSTCTWYACVPA